jgi:hypothetical protein
MRQIHTGARHIRESDANVARIYRTRSAQQSMLILYPSVSVWRPSVFKGGFRMTTPRTCLPDGSALAVSRIIW